MPLFADAADVLIGGGVVAAIGAVGTVLYQLYDRRLKGRAEDADRDAHKEERTLSAAWKMLDRVTVELEVVKRENADLRRQLTASQVEAATSSARIDHLESILDAAGLKYPPRRPAGGSAAHPALPPEGRP